MDPTAAALASTLDRTDFFFALNDALRRDILGLLARGKPMSVSELAAGTGRDPDLLSKHLRVLRDSRLVNVQRDAGNDGRRQLYAVPTLFVTEPGVLDFGFCLLRLG